MIPTVTTHEIIDTNDEPDIKIIEIGGPQNENEQKRRRRRRRRRPRSKLTDSKVSSDDSTCATVSLSSDDMSTETPTKAIQRKKNIKKQYKKNNHKTANPDISPEEQSRYIAMDCEMVGVGYGGRKSSVARVTLVDWNGRIVYDEFVKQDQEVTDYRTFVSGITPLDVEDATLTLEECKRQVQELLNKNMILVGHALKNDLRALGLTHPWELTRDTAKYEPFMQTRFDDNVLWPRKLKDLAREKLQREIQRDGEAHSAYEDAAAAMDLYRLVRRKWEKVMDYKIQKTKQIVQSKQQ